MPQFLLAIEQPDGRPDELTLAAIHARLVALDDDLRADGSWVFTGGLHPPAAAKVVRPGGLVTDGPYLEAKEHLGGLWILTAPDLDAALVWARRAADATTLPIEVREFQTGAS